MKAWQSTLQSFFNIRPGEGAKVGVMFLYSLLTVGGIFIIGRSVSRALFLSSLPKEAIAYRFILPPVVVILVTALYTRLAHRYNLTQLIIGTTSILAAGVLIFRLLLGTPYGDSFGVLAAMFVFFEVIALLTSTQFWAFAGELFDPRQAKRLFGLISMGGIIANVVGGASLNLLATILAPKNLIFIVVLCLAGCIACVWVLGRGDKLEAARPATAAYGVSDRPKQRSLLQDLKVLGQSPLLIIISGLAIMLVVMSVLTEYQLDLVLQATFAGDAGQISAFLGAFFFWAGLVACFIQFFVTSRVLARFGITAGLLFSPIGYALGAIAILITGGMLWATALTRAADVMFRPTINSTTINLLYLPAPASLRKQAKTLVQGVLIPPVIIIMGLTFFFLGQVEGLRAWHWSIPILLLVGVWVILAFRARREYTQSLVKNLQKSRLTLEGRFLNLNDNTTVQALIKTLQHPDELLVISALNLLSGAPQVNWAPQLRPLLNHSVPEVRMMAVKELARLGNRAEAELILGLCQDQVGMVQAAAIEAYCALVKEQAISRIMPFLQQGEPDIKRAVVVGLVKYGGLEGILPAVEQLKSMLANDQAQMRLEAARALGDLQIPTFYQPLIPLFDDPQPEVQLAAIRAAGAVRAPELALYLVHKLHQPAIRQAAIEALTQFGSIVEPLLAQTLADPKIEQEIRRYIPEALQRLGSPQAAASLLGCLKESDRVVRGAIFVALTRLRDAGVHFEVEKEQLREALWLELGYYYQVYLWQADLELSGTGEQSLLDEALTVRLKERLDRIFFLLELLYSVQTIDAVRATLQAEDSPQRANAIELLDNIIERELKILLLPLIEGPPAQVFEIARQRFNITRRSKSERLSELARYPDPWLCSCAIFQIGRLSLTDLIEPVMAALSSDNDLVRETALVTSKQLTRQVL